MTFIRHIIFLSVFLLFSVQQTQAQDSAKTIVLKGQLVDRMDDHLILARPGNALSNANSKIELNPNGSFLDSLIIYGPPSVYELVFPSELRRAHFVPVEFFTDADTIFFELHESYSFYDPAPVPAHKHVIKGGELNEQYYSYRQKYRELADSMDVRIIRNEVDKLNFQSVRTEEQDKMKALLTDSLRAINDSLRAFKSAYIYEDTDIVRYHLFMKRFNVGNYRHQKNLNIDSLATLFKRFRSDNPDHYYTEKGNELFWKYLD